MCVSTVGGRYYIIYTRYDTQEKTIPKIYQPFERLSQMQPPTLDDFVHHVMVVPFFFTVFCPGTECHPARQQRWPPRL